jgi:hypothetical protein
MTWRFVAGPMGRVHLRDDNGGWDGPTGGHTFVRKPRGGTAAPANQKTLIKSET